MVHKLVHGIAGHLAVNFPTHGQHCQDKAWPVQNEILVYKLGDADKFKIQRGHQRVGALHCVFMYCLQLRSHQPNKGNMDGFGFHLVMFGDVWCIWMHVAAICCMFLWFVWHSKKWNIHQRTQRWNNTCIMIEWYWVILGMMQLEVLIPNKLHLTGQYRWHRGWWCHKPLGLWDHVRSQFIAECHSAQYITILFKSIPHWGVDPNKHYSQLIPTSYPHISSYIQFYPYTPINFDFFIHGYTGHIRAWYGIHWH